MGNFFITVPLIGAQRDSKGLFRAGLDSARILLRAVPSAKVENDRACAAVFPRLNGSGTAIASDLETQSWLFSIGTWFHQDGYASGDERRLLEEYLSSGAASLASGLEGFFVVVVGDGRTGETVVITDIVGSCHCFVRKLDGAVALSGSSLLLASLAPFELDEIGCQEFLRAGTIYEDRTCYKEVRKVGPASLLRLGGAAEKPPAKYWSVGTVPPESIRGRDAAGTLWNRLTCAATKIGSAFTNPLCDLTGGNDSRALVAAIWAAGVPATTVVSGPENSPDVVISRQLADIAHFPHLHDPGDEKTSFAQIAEALPFTDGEYDLVEYARILGIHSSRMNRFDISINGSFGEVARGYWWELLFPRAGAYEKLDARKIGRMRFATATEEPCLFPAAMRLDLTSHFASIVERTGAGLSGSTNTMQMDQIYLMMRMQRWQGRIASSTNRIWPCLSPFMFRSVLETMLATEARLRRRGLLIRQMLAEFQPAWASVPLEHGFPAVPANWKNFYQFLPVLTHYGGKAWSKALGTLGRKQKAPAKQSSRMPARLQLWSEEEVHSILDARTAKLDGLLDVSALQDFLRNSQGEYFRFEAQWNRLLSLEYTLRVLHSHGNPGSVDGLRISREDKVETENRG